MTSVNKQNVTFPHKGLKVAAILNVPNQPERTGKLPAIVCVHPGSSCKNQTAGIYAEKLAEIGYITLVFDALYQGESEGSPRYIEDPAARVEDVRCAVDYLTTLPDVDENRIGVLGVCAGGGYAVNAAMTERRIKAVGTVVGVNIGRTYRDSNGDTDGVIKALEAVSQQRTAEARGTEPMITNWIPKNQEEREKAGITDIDIKEAVDYYTTPRGQHPCSPNLLRFTSVGSVIGFDAFHLVDQLLTQPLEIIIGEVPGAFGSYKDGHELYNRAASKKKHLHIVKGACHYDLYDKSEPVAEAVQQLEAFYKENL
ncbi:dienelactone hydrolase domain protein [Basidiobolus meristosporus CBS 931.73]|uniref:Dienelactone hydrolase domain protein n=1 Tax=Basidiobolus meristosporus CBS 931.73 TaxID=1314790 RepID=A0A1Y1XRP1_9FUNG|nr:dienelactone hydrolase domain protein [Basidiobolus meristosporus CBS 931.73]|eukprot:ORX88432.1 dienelactone hydrolase domain protein [Basidiobolus meristosporus CBS 931.73]